jgi:hypothetical protein
MRCLYCGKELALLKRLTGGGEFCSDSHKQSYQEEYNRLALSRLLQAQSKTGDKAAAQNAPARPAEPVRVSAPVAVAEPAPVPEPVMVAAHVEAEEVEDTFLPPEAGFALEMPALCYLPEGTPYVEPWMESRVELVTPKWHFKNGLTSSLPGADELLRLEIHPKAWQKTQSDNENHVTPQEFNSGKVDLTMPLAVKSSHEIPTAGPVDLEFAPKAPETNRNPSLAGPLDFQFQVVTHNPAFWERPQSVIEYSTEDADVLFPASWSGFDSIPLVDVPEKQGADEPEPDRTPRAALEALSRLHQNMVAEQTEVESAAQPKPLGEPSVSLAEESEAHETVAVLVEAPQQAIEASATEPSTPVIDVSVTVDDEPVPSASSDLLTIPLKSFPPAKSTLAIESDALNTLQQPTLPRLKALPLRPKVAMAPPGFAPQPKAPQMPQPQTAKNPVTEAKLKSATTIPIPPRTADRPKPAVSNRPPGQPPKPSQAVQPPKPGAPVRAAQPSATAQVQAPAKPPATTPPAPAAKSPATQQSPAPAAKSPVPQQSPAPAAKSPATQQPPAPAAKSPTTQPPAPAVKAPATPAAAQGAKAPATREPIRVPPTKPEQPKPRSKPDLQPSSAPDQPTLTFETLQLQMMNNDNTSFIGSLKGKLAVAVGLVILLGSVAYFMSGKSHKTSASNSEIVDSVGPSIMMGEGGWVQNWGSDPLNAHVGRQITIYRPSLKLSDYRIEFQGQIDTKSMGWVFRAADPNNYYAMKLMMTPGTSPRLTLVKLVVRSGRETEAGRVSLNIPAHNDTIFGVRTDVRGLKFSTYIQGQPVDVWTDNQLPSGGVGFLNERSERARIKTVSIAYLTGGAK